MKYKKIIIITSVIFLLGCFALSELNGLGTVKGEVTVIHTDNDSWHIDYNFDQSVIGIMTGPETKKYHDSSWDLPEDFHFTKDESGYSWLEKKDKSAFKKISVNVKTYKKIVFYAPQPFANFNQGVSINTGPLGFASKIRLLGLVEMMHNFDLRYSFIGLKDESILVPNSDSTEDIAIKGSGYFVFFGNRDMITESEQVQLLLDNDFPSSLRADVLSTAEKFMTLYNKEFGKVLNGKLMIQMTYDKNSRNAGKGFGIGGGAQNGQFAGIMSGSFDSIPIAKVTMKLRTFMAHEMGHIWQSHIGMDDMRWMNEGGAEIISHRGMVRLGMLTEKGFNTFLNKYLVESIEDLQKVSLEAPHKKGYEQLNYSGGSLAVWAACAAIDGDNKSDNIFKMNRELAKFSKDSLTRFPKDCIASTFTKLGMNQEKIDGIDHFINTKHKNPQDAYAKLFDLTGIPYKIKGDSIFIVE
ncbi:MAG: hypothetical protein OSB25_01320 [Salibacteraceae bacterium]|nr:hypothetical protein [Salibacteraceae bacterium]|tara:strand:+ start:15033 stop:16433 length:1401 start_codon:yes stop_codon:yes gene_type:complete